MSTIKLIIADDHRIIRDGLKMLISQNSQLEVIGEVSNGEELLYHLNSTYADLVLLDISMPKLNGLESLPLLKLNFPLVRILIISMHDEPEYVLKAVQLGADGYILKNADHAEINRAIDVIMSGKKYFNAEVSNIMIEALNQKPVVEKTKINLTQRESEVLKLVAQGMSNKLIADALNISPRTVETHRTNLLRKFEAFNTAELVSKATMGRYL